jgi:hypothetical protein
MVSPERDFQAVWLAEVGDRPVGHDHFWDRALSRRQLLGRGAGLAGIAAASAVGFPTLARAAGPGAGVPKPVPGGTVIDGLGLFHFYFPTSPNPVGSPDTVESGRGDPSTITDFNGFLGLAEFGNPASPGTGTDGDGATLYWAADVRFMDGEYVGVDGRHRQGAFAFV